MFAEILRISSTLIQFVRECANASGIPTGFVRAFAGSQAQLLSVLPLVQQ